MQLAQPKQNKHISPDIKTAMNVEQIKLKHVTLINTLLTKLSQRVASNKLSNSEMIKLLHTLILAIKPTPKEAPFTNIFIDFDSIFESAKKLVKNENK